MDSCWRPLLSTAHREHLGRFKIEREWPAQRQTMFTLRFIGFKLNSKFENSSRNSMNSIHPTLTERNSPPEMFGQRTNRFAKRSTSKNSSNARRPDSPTRFANGMQQSDASQETHTHAKERTLVSRAVLAVSNGNSLQNCCFFLHFLSLSSCQIGLLPLSSLSHTVFERVCAFALNSVCVCLGCRRCKRRRKDIRRAGSQIGSEFTN